MGYWTLFVLIVFLIWTLLLVRPLFPYIEKRIKKFAYQKYGITSIESKYHNSRRMNFMLRFKSEKPVPLSGQIIIHVLEILYIFFLIIFMSSIAVMWMFGYWKEFAFILGLLTILKIFFIYSRHIE